MPTSVFRWYLPLGSTTGYNLPSLRDEGGEGKRVLWLCSSFAIAVRTFGAGKTGRGSEIHSNKILKILKFCQKFVVGLSWFSAFRCRSRDINGAMETFSVG
jgi:hypothetical protein